MYLRAESHNKVATIIFYFARAVSHAAAQTDRLCYIESQLSPRPALNLLNRFNLLHSCGEANYTVSGHSKSRSTIDDFGPDENTLLSERF